MYDYCKNCVHQESHQYYTHPCPSCIYGNKNYFELAEGNEPPPDVDVISLIKELETEKLRADNNKREAEYLDKNSAEKDKEYKKRIAELEKTLKAAIEDMRRNSHIKNVRN